MSFLRKRDYFSVIREAELDTVLKELQQTTALSPTLIRQEAEKDVQEVIETHIQHRYDVRKIFTEIIPFVLADQYQIGELVEYSETPYVSATTYVAPNRVSFSETVSNVLRDNIFEANQAVSAAETPATNPEKWDLITENATLYEVIVATSNNLPDTAFAFTENAFTGNHDQIERWDKANTLFLKRIDNQIRIYYSAADRTADNNSVGIVDFKKPAGEFPDNRPIEPGTDIENILSGDLSFIGFVPDATEWSVVPSNFFTKQDNRSRLIKKMLVELVVFELHKLINPRMIPELRFDAKEDQMKILKSISAGRVQADLPIFFDEKRGQRITFDSEKKLRHNY